jgi:hypothetical protein
MKTFYSLRPDWGTEQGIERAGAWAKANGLDPADLPDSQTMRVEDGKLTVTVVVHGVNGILPGDEVTRVEVRRTVPLVELPPEDLFISYELRERI